MSESILVIKLGALGDFVQALGPMAAIRAHHKSARIVLLTTRPYVALAEATGLVDEVWLDPKPKLFQIGTWRALRRSLKRGNFNRVYDLQTSDRSSWYYHLFLPQNAPEWSGIARGCSHPHANPARDAMHTIERQAEQLKMAGVSITEFDDPAKLDISWAGADVTKLAPRAPYWLLAPGGAAHRPDKRWPAENFTALARRLTDAGRTPVLIGGADEGALSGAIAAGAPGTLDLAGRTDLLELAALAKGAEGAVGNDTGPMHLAAAVGCPTWALYSNASDPALCGQRGRQVTILRRPSLAELAVPEVAAALPLDKLGEAD
jgi:ADP-heptose:LPS heptosyltransferase